MCPWATHYAGLQWLRSLGFTGIVAVTPAVPQPPQRQLNYTGWLWALSALGCFGGGLITGAYLFPEIKTLVKTEVLREEVIHRVEVPVEKLVERIVERRVEVPVEKIVYINNTPNLAVSSTGLGQVEGSGRLVDLAYGQLKAEMSDARVIELFGEPLKTYPREKPARGSYWEYVRPDKQSLTIIMRERDTFFSRELVVEGFFKK